MQQRLIALFASEVGSLPLNKRGEFQVVSGVAIPNLANTETSQRMGVELRDRVEDTHRSGQNVFLSVGLPTTVCGSAPHNAYVLVGDVIPEFVPVEPEPGRTRMNISVSTGHQQCRSWQR